MPLKNFKLRSLIWIGGGAAVVALAIAIGSSAILYEHTINLLTDNLRQRLLSISITQAANLDADDVNALQTEGDWTKPEWARVVSKLKKTKTENPNIVFMYIFRRVSADPASMEFVADAESLNPYANTDSEPSNDVDANHDGKIEAEGADKLQWPGQPYEEAKDIPETQLAYSGPLTVKDLYNDSYGDVLTGYAPITNASGTVVAVLGTDIKADDFFTVTRQTLYPFVIFIMGLIAIIALLSGTLIYIWEKRAYTLAKLSEELEIANQRQEGLIHFISHEVKGALGKGVNIYSMILEGDYGALPDKMQPLFKQGLHDSREAVDMVTSILLSSNLKSGQMKFTMAPFDMREAIQYVVDMLTPDAQAKGLTLSMHIPAGDYKINGDKEIITKHIIRNIIDNSIRYTPTGSVTVSLARKGGMLVFSVADTGVGITDEDKSRLFTEGGRGKESVKVNVNSTGYGLFFAKQLVEAHKGTIRAESAGKGQGSTFVVELPAG